MKRLYLLIYAFTAVLCLSAQTSANEQQAIRMFEEVAQLMDASSGISFKYAVSFSGVTLKSASVWTKGKKSKESDGNSITWDDGVTRYELDRKENTVTIKNSTSKGSNKMVGDESTIPANYHYSLKEESQGYLITLKAKKGVKGPKELRVLLDKKTRYPKSFRVKEGIFVVTLKLSDVKVGNINDNLFVFPRSQYSNCKFIDKR